MKSKTVEEILQDYGCGTVPFDRYVKMYYPAIISAMEEYASQFQHPVPYEAGEVYSRKQLEDAHIVGYTKGRIAEQDSDSIYQDAVNYATSIHPSIALPKSEDKACMYYYPLFKFFSDEHSLSLLDSEIQEIIIAVEMFNISKLSPAPPSGEDAGKGWISVEERLPEVGEYVLVSLENGYTELMGRLLSNNVWVAMFLDGEKTADINFVTHWHPLPPKP